MICPCCGKQKRPADLETLGTSLKPAWEPVLVFRKPPDGTIAANFLKHGTGALNIDGCRIGWASDEDKEAAAAAAAQRVVHAEPGAPMSGLGKTGFTDGPGSLAPYLANMDRGRWPANVALTHAEGCERIGTRKVDGHGLRRWDKPRDMGFAGGTNELDGRMVVTDDVQESWQCAPGCPVAELDAQSGNGTSTPFRENVATGAVLPLTFRSAGGYSDSGGASRFFFTAKASRVERDAGLDDFEPKSGGQATDRKDESAALNSPRSGSGRRGGARNSHPTIKPVDLMRWLVRLVSRPGFLILDPFCGSGTTGIATMLEGEGRRFIGLELEPLHVDFARARIAHKIGGTPEREIQPERPYEKRQLSIYDAIRAGR